MNHYFLIAILVQALMSTIPSASKLVITQMPVEPYIALRWSIAAAIFGCLCIIQKVKWTLPIKDYVLVSLLGLGGYGIASLGTLYGLKLGGVSFFGLMTLSNPVLVAVMSTWILSEKFGYRTWFACALALVGILLTVSGQVVIANSSSTYIAGICIVIAYVFDTLVFLKSKSFKERLPLVQYIFIAQSAAAIFMWIVSFLFYPVEKFLPPTAISAGALVYVSIASCAIGFFVWYWLLGHLKGQQLGFLTYVHGILAAWLGVLFFNEAFNVSMLAGSFFFLLSIFAVSKSSMTR